MKTSLILFFSLFMANVCVGQMRPIIIIFKTGDTIRGVGKMRLKSVKYKDVLNEREAEEFEFSKIELVKLVIPQNKSVNYRFFQTKDDSRFIAVEEVVASGEVTLFTTTENSANPYSSSGMSGIKYYLKRKNEETITNLGPYSPLMNNLKDKVKEYFADCSKLIRKIERGDFRVRRGLTEMVEFYNKECN